MSAEKLNRNLKICKLVDENEKKSLGDPTKLLRKDIAKLFGIDLSRITRIIDTYWKSYQIKKR